MNENMKKTKMVRVNCSALTRVEASVLVEVPANFNADDYRFLQEVYDSLDGEDFKEDTDYWERGDGYAESPHPHDFGLEPEFVLNDDGDLIRRKGTT